MRSHNVIVNPMSENRKIPIKLKGVHELSASPMEEILDDLRATSSALSEEDTRYVSPREVFTTALDDSYRQTGRSILKALGLTKEMS